ncbi:hypothetical protein HF313_23070 [Massilia atriviolacea]|uniref:Uncharacterized protein n=1 Tax=Massilia atriviolacea TaxID=2495579 RepID=A0A430HKP3_9BURK|nr:hypothetical protein [Massilia atriviolacea]RSZ58072.1 hypothetical protein EJB06_17420 [Massilia atriviolacea]
MDHLKVDGAMYEVLKLRDTINRISSGFSDIGPIFGLVSLQLPRLEPSELGFIRVVSWLYVHYFEVGKLGGDFLGAHAEAASMNISLLRDHRDRIQQLRTYCQHNLNFTDSHSNSIQNACESWFKEKCGTHLPIDEHHWSTLLQLIILEALNYFRTLEKIIRFIETNEAFEQILEQWQLRIKRYFPPHKFDKIIEEVAADWGRDNFDATKFRKRHYDKWRGAFDYQTEEADLEREGRKLVETAMLADQMGILPIDGRDVMSQLNIAPGSAVQELLKIACDLNNAKPYSREALLAELADRKVQILKEVN